MCWRCASLSKMPGSRLLMVTLCATVCRARPADEADQPGARAVRQAELELRNLHAARHDVDDAAEAARHHAVDGEPDHLDGAQHHGVERRDPVVPRPVAEVAGQRAVGVVEQDVGRGTGRERRGASLRRGDVADDGVTLTPVAARISAQVGSSTSRVRATMVTSTPPRRAPRRRPCRARGSRRSAAPFVRGCRDPRSRRSRDQAATAAIGLIL